MTTVKILDVLKEMSSKKEVLVSFNLFNNASINGVFRAAQKVNRPVMLGVTERDLAHYGLEELVKTVRIKAERTGVITALHLDHGMSLEAAVRCIRAGFSSVMLDPSGLEPEKRIPVVREVMDFARSADVMVESMVGQLKLALDDIQGEGVSKEELTDPVEAASFVRETGIDILAVSVGTEHGSAFAGKEEEIDMPRLRAIAEAVPVPLVVHGGSGVSAGQLRELRNYHVGKMNIGGAIRVAYTKAVMKALTENPYMDMNDADAAGEEAICETAAAKLRILSC
ncbi:MAG: class II fructose-bisphosphate aldolase [Treponema sp.]|jgi:ketose-bisphosphate aldolase|nr:class II fructose-bisphosphate aldolase [Treponema sp.]